MQRRLGVAEVGRQALAHARVTGKKIQHGVNACNLAHLFGLKVSGQLVAQGGSVGWDLQHRIHLGHLLGLQLDPAFLRQIVQCGDHAAMVSGITLCQSLKVQRAPGAGPGSAVKDGLHKLLAFSREVAQDGLGRAQVLEPVLGKVGVARGNDGAQLQLHQQGFEWQQADAAVLGECIECQLPRLARRNCQQFIQHPANALRLGGVAVNKGLQHRQALVVDQCQAV